jgi:hypothetical protein
VIVTSDVFKRLDARLAHGKKCYLAFNKGWALVTLNIWQRILRTLLGAYKNTHLSVVAKAMAEARTIPEEMKTRVRKLWYATYPGEKCPIPPTFDPALLARIIEVPSVSKHPRGFDYIDRKRPLGHLRKKYEGVDHPIRKGIDKIHLTYDFYPIADDGHCLFRSIAAGLLLQLQEHPELKNKMIKRLEHLIESIDFEDILKQDVHWLNDLIRDLKGCTREKSFFRCIDDRDFSDRLVIFFRNLAAIQGRSDQSLSSSVNEEQWKKIQDFDQKERGGHVVIQALVKSLQIAIHIVDLQAIGKGSSKERRQVFSEPHPIVSIALLFTENHYDLAIPILT